MPYPVCRHPGDTDHANGVTIPDFPGCFSAAAVRMP
ncbi:type II toxin-antitoxin system HicB family antitoxin [Lamprocystis purpurea]|nr:type II toxin-antitoxin system HicB family antitoxin [Lamprocystis purpurea]